MHVTLDLPSCVTQWIARTVIPLPLYFAPDCRESPPSAHWPVALSFPPLLLLYFTLPFSSSAPLTLSLISVPGSTRRSEGAGGATAEAGIRRERPIEAADLFHSPLLRFFAPPSSLSASIAPLVSSLPVLHFLTQREPVSSRAHAQVCHLFKCPLELHKDVAASRVYLYICRSAHATALPVLFFSAV